MKTRIAGVVSSLAILLLMETSSRGQANNGITLQNHQVVVRAGGGITVTMDNSGHYDIEAGSVGWKFSGDSGVASGTLDEHAGRDVLGAFQEVKFDAGGFSRTIRAYADRPVVLFGITTIKALSDEVPQFPRFTSIPGGLNGFSYHATNFAPPSFKLEQTATPWLLFDNRNAAAILSPANNFFLAKMSGDGSNLIASGLNPGATNLPAGFTLRSLLTFGNGINATWEAWGRTLTDLNGKTRQPNDADIGLRCLGYWTDNGAAYYYNYDPALGYGGTLEALVNHYRERGIPIRYLQLDSWWYYKSFRDPDGRMGKIKNARLPEGEWNRYGGLMQYKAHPAVLPDGLAGFQKKIGLPLITHNRWVDPDSPYHQHYKISGVAAVDRGFWDELMGYIQSGGVICYEQDWLDRIYLYSPELGTTPGLGEAFSDGMADAAKARGLSVQYCMGLPRNFLQASHYNNVITIRTSDDRFGRNRWDRFLYTSRLAAALGIWPWADVFYSNETNNLIIATLSAGMVGVGDRIGAENKENLLRAARADGVLVKPDAPLLPTDAAYIAEAADTTTPMVAATYTDHAGHRTAYVFAYNRRDTNCVAEIRPADCALRDEVWVYQPSTGTARKVSANNPWSIELEKGGAAFLEIAPLGTSHIAFFGDAGKFVGTGRKRISDIDEQWNQLTTTVSFGAGEENVTLFGYADTAPKASAIEGQLSGFIYDATTKRFEFTVSPAAAVTHESPGDDPVRRARVRITMQ